MRRAYGRAAAVAACTALVVGGPSWTPTASAAPPSGLTPSGAVATSTPTLRWVSGSPAGTKFVVQADDDPGFGSPAFTITTANRAYTPTANLPAGTVSWRVREDVTGATWTSSEVDVTATAPPVDLVPNGSSLANPDEAPLLSWTAVPGASGYEVQIHTSENWIGAATYTTSGAQLHVPKAQEPDRTWFWRVRAQRGAGLFTQWSETASYRLLPLDRVTPRQPVDDNTPDVPEAPGVEVSDVFLEWDPVPGAVRYELQVGLDRDFTLPVETRTVVGTRYSPVKTYDNDQFFWRVRPVDSSGHKIAWHPDDTQEFQRIWPDTPVPVHPVDAVSPAVPGPLYLQWTPVAHATVYQVDVGTDANFSPRSYDTCTTHLTTVVLGTQVMRRSQCDTPAGQGQTTYWRVRGIDEPTGVEGLYSPVQRFTYARPAVAQVLPAPEATVTVPTLSWQDQPDIDSYVVEVRRGDGSLAASTTTRALSWTPPSRLLKSGTSSERFTWTVQSVDAYGKRSPLRPGRAFTLTSEVADPVEDVPLSPVAPLPGNRAPGLAWSPWPGAHSYRVWVRSEESEFWLDQSTTPLTNTRWQFPAATDTGTYFHSPGTYVWFVQALASNGSVLGEGATSSFEIQPVQTAAGHAVALDGLSAVDSAHACTKALRTVVEEDTICSGLPSTPMLTWDPVPDAAYYLVYLANDREMTNRVLAPQQTPTHLWAPPDALPDNQAGQSYYWFVRPCRSSGACAPDPIGRLQAAGHAFRKTSPPVVLSDSRQHRDECQALGGGVSQDCLGFSWEDYRDTNASISFDPRQPTRSASPITSPQSARGYRIEVSASPSFATLVDSATVDQAGYTPYDKTYPEGDLFWRVQAIDAAGTPLQWSEPSTLTKASGPVEGLLPGTGAVGSGLPTFSWDPKAYAASYRIEVYRGTDGTFSPANRVLSESTPHRSFVWSKYLPASDQPYSWRVQWTDASGRQGPWTAPSNTIAIRPGAVALLSPAQDAFEQGDRVHLTWQPVDLAASYRVEVESVEGRRVADVTTVATAWNPTSALGNGSYRWRVTARDPQSGSLASSGWRALRVDAVRPTVVGHAPARRLKRSGGVLRVTFSEPVTGVDARAFRLVPVGSRKALPARVTMGGTGLEATLTPTRPLKRRKSYTVMLDSRPVDAAGNRLVPHTWVVRAR